MKVVIQRAKKSSVEVEGKIVGLIDHGLVILVCLEAGDSSESLHKAAEKILNLRIFSDEKNRMNQNVKQVEGSILAISQFTLSWDGSKGNRPSFDKSMDPEQAKLMFAEFCSLLRHEVPLQTGIFGAEMTVSIINDGPVTFSLSF